MELTALLLAVSVEKLLLAGKEEKKTIAAKYAPSKTINEPKPSLLSIRSTNSSKLYGVNNASRTVNFLRPSPIEDALFP
jgi:hypothetical protein